jgi:pSer/pThr/pTyr-binding forkhead associated (FHA) protein
MIAQLVALSDGSSILLDKPVLLIGRHPECDIQIESRKVSRRHCCVALVADYLVVRDLGSTNGIRINGVRVVEGRLKPGDELTIGSHRYQVRVGPPESLDRPRARRVTPAPPGPEDDLLEECDDPVPLEEPESPPLQPVPARGDEGAPMPAKPPASMIIPDQLDLAPASDIVPPAPPSPPPA